MEVRVLGPLEVRVGDDVIPVRAGRPRKLLAVLALRLGDRVTTDALVDLLWGDDVQRDRVNALRILVSYLRKVLSATDGTVRIDTVEGGYRLVAPRDAVDAHRFDAAVASAARESEPRARLALLDEALSLWRGPAAPELADEEFARAELQRLTELRLAALEQRTDCLLLLGRHVEAVADLQRLVAEHPLRERFHAQLMTALYRAARQAEALAVYERARRLLAEELGLDPGPELQAVAQAVLQQSPELGAPEPPPTEVAPAADADGQGGPGRVPRPLDPLIGRGDEVERLSTLLSSRRLVTLTGPGGAGKTRLAAELAACLPATAWWVDLSAAENADSVLAAVARGTDATASGDDARAALVSQLTSREGLLVLDTCERVRAPVRALAELVLRSCPGVRILATSRQPLGAATELAWPVPPLSLPDPDADSPEVIGAAAAVQLFLERAANRRPGLELTADNCVDIARICLLLDGLPLAIELAAAHAGMLEPRTMVRVLDDRLRLLVDETKDERQHTLRATIAWSHELLSEDEAAFFARLSVFAGAFPMEAAEAVAGAGLGRDGLELLLALAQQSLVVAAGGDRFRLLDTVRAFAAERLAARGPDEAQTRRRHVVWYVEVLGVSAPGERRPRVKGWLGDLRDVLPDARRALEWCFTGGDDELGARLLSELSWLWPREGVFEEAAAWFPKAKALVEPGSALQADLLTSSGTHAVSRGDLETAVRDCSTAVDLYDRMAPRHPGAHALLALGVAYWGLGDYTRAAAVHDRAVRAFAELNDLWGVSICLSLRARTAIDAGEPDAVARLEAAEAAAIRSGDDHALGVVLMQRGRADMAAGDTAAAERHALESLRRNQQNGHHEGVLGSLHVLGFVRVGQGDLDGAGAHFTRALRSAVAMHHVGATAESLDGLGLVASRRGRAEDAAALFAAAEDLRARRHIRRTPLTARLVERARAELADTVAQDDLGRAERRGLGLELPDLLDLAVRTA
jgi:predicted ATPase/DNA-binding SARP family transcriptional activator